MKKFFMMALALLLVLGLCACNQTADAPAAAANTYTFPDGTAIYGVDLSGQTAEAGWKTLTDSISDHVMTVSVDGVPVSVTAQQIGLTCSKERYDAIATAMEAGAPVEYSGLISYNEGKLRALVNENFNKPVTEAAIVYDEEAGKYALIPDAIGQISNPNELVSLLKTPILALETEPALTDVSQIIEPTIRDEDEAVAAALEAVNKMLSAELTYTFTCEGKTSTLDISQEVLRSLITLGPDNVTPGINQYELEAYVAELSETYSAGSVQAPFQTTGGGTIGLTVSYNGVYLDKEAMAEDLATCILEGISGTRTAPFQAAGIRDMPYGGTYIEVNLDSQYLWFYKYGECILSTSFVSGNVATGHITPNGVFSIYYKSPDTYLEGADYRTFVNFWMPFYGGYGLHDATWRGVFGGENYLYNGSHGCVNLPYNAAATIYSYAPVGTPVIVYGGRTSVPPQPQSLGGTTSYSVADDAGTITLDIRPRYSGPSMSYSSSNSKVASVSSGGVVTVKGVGTAVITVSVPSYSGYTSATTSVTINVHSACEDGRHKLGTPTTVTPATCQPGQQKTSCTKCNYSETKELPATAQHKFTTYTKTQAPTCSTAGKEVSTCDTCRTEKHERTVAATGNHTPGTPATTKQPNCTDKGVTETRCTVCNTVVATGELATVPTAHVPGTLEEKAATCTENGYRKQSCTKCSQAIVNDVLTASGHSHSWVTTTAPTCTNAGEKANTCSVCGNVAGTEPISATGHSSGWSTTTSPSCTADGEKQLICSVCGTVEATEPIFSTGHSYNGGVCGNCGGADPNYVAPTPQDPAPDNQG